MQKSLGYSLLAFATLTLPSFALGAETLFTLLTLVSRFMNGVIGLFITVAIVVFFWGLISYLTEVGEKKSAGLSIMLWGVIAIFVMVSLWGIIRVLQRTVGTTDNQAIPLQGLIVQP